jgi:hypothetical protein
MTDLTFPRGSTARTAVVAVGVAVATLAIAGCGSGEHSLRAATAQASTGSVPGKSCKPANRRSTLRLTAFGTSCATARKLERMGNRQDPEQGFHVDGKHWDWYVYSRANGHTYQIYSAVPGQVYVQLVSRRPVS